MSKSPSQTGAFRHALETAKGVSAHVIIVFADIRDFSRFSRANDPTDVATYVSRIYLRLTELFPLADFYKAAGDGLLITIPYEDIVGDDSELKAKAQSVVEACLTCVETFRDFCSGDPMVNFEVPHQIGFGVTRGSACCIVSGGRILDYSGHRLNLAARLMDLARPEGVILDKSFGLELLDTSTAKMFSEEHVYVRSLAEETPIPVWIQTGRVVIREEAKRPLGFDEWKDMKPQIIQLKAWRDGNPSAYKLAGPLKRPDAAVVHVRYPVRKAGKLTGDTLVHKSKAWKYSVVGNDHRIRVNTASLCKYLRKQGVLLKDDVTLLISLVPKP